MIIIYTTLFLSGFYFINIKTGYKYIYLTIILLFILGGNLYDKKFQFFFLLPHEWAILIVFTVLTLDALIRPYKFSVTWVDKIYFFYLLCVVLVPVLGNLGDLLISKEAHISALFYPLKLWMVYRIFHYIFLRYNFFETKKIKEQIDLILNLILLISLISGFIGLMRYSDISLVADFVNSNWPVKGNPAKDFSTWKRMVATMSGTNGGGLFFAICVIISLYQHIKYKKKKYLLSFSVFSFYVILTGSLSAIGTLIISIIIYFLYTKSFSIKYLIVLPVILGFFITPIIYMDSTRRALKNVIELRIQEQFKRSGTFSFMPHGLKGRFEDWVIFYKYFKAKPFIGYGFKEGVVGGEDMSARSTLSENYYVELLIYSGILGLLAYIFLNYLVLKKLGSITLFQKEAAFIKLIIYMYLISQITQLSFTYNGLSELFGVLLALTYFMNKSEEIENSLVVKESINIVHSKRAEKDYKLI